MDNNSVEHIVTPVTGFADDVRKGLSETPKCLSSKYFYDERGDKLFQEIMAMPEYYLTGSERDIFQENMAGLLQAFGPQPFDLVELGAGDGSKTKILLRHFLAEKTAFRYQPIDISGHVLDELQKDLHKELPGLEVMPMKGDYMKMLEQINVGSGYRKVILFLGSNIGNMEKPQAAAFLQRLEELMLPGDYVLLGIDLKKDPSTILAAYDDSAGVTAAFNLNLLRRINRELGGDFDTDAFSHWETYDPVSGSARSFLISRKEQKVRIDALGMEFAFEDWEPIRVELSQKYSLREVEKLVSATGLIKGGHFQDKRKYFVDTLWKKA